MKLIRVKRSNSGAEFGFNIRNHRLQRIPEAIIVRTVANGDNVEKDYEFFIVHSDVDTEVVANWLATHNPGFEVQVFGLEQVYESPPGEVVTKKVTQDGILPVFNTVAG